MTPYGGALYFGVLLYPTLIALGLGLAERLSWRWILAITVGMVVVQYWGAGAWGVADLAPAGTVREVWLIAGYAVAQWAIARAFLAVRVRRADAVQSGGAWAARRDFAVAVVLSVAPLAAAKALPLLAPGTTAGFLGISYVTFRCLDVIIGIQDRLITTLPAGRYVTYLFFFPTISSGPIDRYRRFVTDLEHRRTRAEVLSDLGAGLHRIFTGLLYKFILAALVHRYWLQPVTGADGALATVSYMYAYSAYLFLDFAGYSHFAIGVSYFFGIRTPENFDRPWLAANIADFWNRWHMSLSFWFRDHIYMRFVIAATKGRWFPNKNLASYTGFFLTFGLMGLWHGPAWHYIAYGLYHAALLSGHAALNRRGRQRDWWGSGPVWRAAGIVLTINLVCFGFLIFSGRLR
ncbi:MAG: D-alanyl-lipoteichoic acid biosynthesis protein DltB [Gemmatimonadota bacterium]|nr:D-alanyl-lipoteichoic acid biosynthesis protein DltB [Gemmatimonadota bacterium]